MPTRPRVLIINSDPNTRSLLRWLLHLHAERVIEAAGSAETPALIRALEPTVVVMDVRLRGLPNGYTLLRWIKEIAPGLPVVVYTDTVSAQRARRCGVAEVVVQGEHHLDALLAAVQRAHDRYSSDPRSGSPTGGVAPARPAAGAGPCWSAGRADLFTHPATAILR